MKQYEYLRCDGVALAGLIRRRELAAQLEEANPWFACYERLEHGV